MFSGGNDGGPRKTLASFVSGNPPTAAYRYGSSLTGPADRPQTRDLTATVRDDK